ncbi:MAG: 23S rRNA pseudouridine(1911/1915/1917) synthase RluD [Pseudomonadota bacterium]
MSSEILTIPEALSGKRLDQALAALFPQYSRSRLKRWLLDGAVLVDGERWKPRDPVQGGETVQLDAVEDVQVRSAPEAIPLSISFEDEHLLIIDKPPGLVVHPGAGNPTGTLMNGLLAHHAGLETLPRAGIVHRLDKDTSGLLLVGKTLEAHTALTRLLADRDISRRYQAVVNGVLTGGGTIDKPIARHPVDRTRMSVQDNGREAVTHYTVAERYRAHTLVDVKLETGRTHQIRVHFAWRRHALLGDPVYGGRLALPKGASQPLIDALRQFRRQALHAVRLGFEHPMTGEAIDVRAPLPEDLNALLATLKQDTAA